jgi:hypothetical protein
VCKRERERERESEREKERECVCVCVCVRERDIEREREREKEREKEREEECVCVRERDTCERESMYCMHVSNVNTYVSYHQGQDLSFVVKGSPCPGFQSPNLKKRKKKKKKIWGSIIYEGKAFFFSISTTVS